MMEPSFEKLLVLLAEAEIEFVLVGGAAVAFQGYVRLTEDLDLLIHPARENIVRLLQTLEGYGRGFARELDPSDFTEQEGAIRIVEESEQMQIDLFTRIAGRTYSDVVGDSEPFMVRGHRIAVASKKTLIGWKQQSHREKDRLDARALHELEKDPRAFD